MSPRAYSYVRFSTAEQLKGKSLERQTEAAVVYAAQHGLTLDTSLSLKDLGVSAFRGKNASSGALKIFLDRVADGTVPRGSFLLIETFDRMSRESAYDAQFTLQSIINEGVTVVTLTDSKQYSVEIMRSDPMSLIYSILLMSRSHEESATKSKRVADAWARKRQKLREGETLTAHTPKWIRVRRLKDLRPGEQRKVELIPSRAKLVREMFELCLKGVGASKIAGMLNDRNVPCWSGSRFWHQTYVRRCLLNRAAIGELQPARGKVEGRKRLRELDGPPIKDYWPPIISESMFDQAQQLIKARTLVKGPKTGVHLLASLARCPICGSSMERKIKRQGAAPRFICSAVRVRKCKFHSVKIELLERALIAAADQLYEHMPATDPTLKLQAAQIELSLAETDQKLYALGVLLDDDKPPAAIVERLRKLEALKDDLAASLEELKSKLVVSEPQYLRDRAKRMRDALSWHAGDRADTQSVNKALHECFSKIVVNYTNSTLECVWKHGPTSIIPYTE